MLQINNLFYLPHPHLTYVNYNGFSWEGTKSFQTFLYKRGSWFLCCHHWAADWTAFSISLKSCGMISF